MDVQFQPSWSDDERRAHLLEGDLIVLAPNESTLALVRLARRLIEEAFAPHPPQSAHRFLEVANAVEILSRLKPQFIHHPETKERLQRILQDLGCDKSLTYQDVPRLRVAYPADYLSTGIAYAHHPHRDTWYSAPLCQLNWWMPIYDFEANQGMAFHPRYWRDPVVNSSRQFNYYAWNAVGRKSAAQHVKSDTRVQPKSTEVLALEPEVRLVVPAGGIVLFSANHLHSTVRNETLSARWSLDFRTVHLDDLRLGRRPGMSDTSCTGTSLRDFRRMADLAPMPEDVVALYDTGTVSDGVAVYEPA